MVSVTLRDEQGVMMGVYAFITVPRVGELVRVNRKFYRVSDVLHEPGVGVTLTVTYAGV